LAARRSNNISPQTTPPPCATAQTAPRFIAERTAAMTYTPKQPAIYILANKRHGTLYIGVTSNLIKRIHEHRIATTPGFTTKYGCNLLVYFELHADMPTAIAREKQLKAGSRAKKIALIAQHNGAWNDLYPDLI
jgi:putative endonuclease